MHRDGDRNQVGGVEVRVAKHLDGEVNGPDVMARLAQERTCGSDVERLMAELVTGDQ